MSVDGSDNEAEMSAGSKRKAPIGVEQQPVKKKRLTYEDMYDKDDPFVDDTEMAWEEKAAAVQDGFFVYSGLLVAAGAEVNIEKCVSSVLSCQCCTNIFNRADGSTAPKKRSRPSKAAAAAKAAAASKATTDEKDKKADESADGKGTAAAAAATTTATATSGTKEAT